MGDDARAFVAKLRATRGRFVAAQKRSAARLRAKGFTPTDRVVVVLLNPKAQKEPSPKATLRPIAFSPAQTVYSDEGYAIFTSWDDGNDGTWEGNIYFVDTVEGIDTNLDGQLEIANLTETNPPHTQWAEGDMAGPGHEPIPEQPLFGRIERVRSASLIIC